ncbi:hypothetical protein Dda_1769 [Drechslerella dactyloides]|uniref:Uncharacterized protein n=1 Tax=Drechslerella dactyloides TaxID=74499 RepID=A0AAD6J2I5_DREDA|nr:hypothetical protein Dda_1769 [Drechslerella dactyloides]
MAPPDEVEELLWPILATRLDCPNVGSGMHQMQTPLHRGERPVKSTAIFDVNACQDYAIVVPVATGNPGKIELESCKGPLCVFGLFRGCERKYFESIEFRGGKITNWFAVDEAVSTSVT